MLWRAPLAVLSAAINTAMYDEKQLELELYNVCADRKMAKGYCKVAVVTKRNEEANPFVLRNYPADDQTIFPGATGWPERDAARATSAAPGYFVPFEDGEGNMYVDGGVGFNNPSTVALAEVRSALPGSDVSCVLSLGTGTPDYEAQSTSVVTKALNQILRTATDTSYADKLSLLLVQQSSPGSQYLRLNPVLPASKNAKLTSLDISDAETIEQLIAATREALLKTDIKEFESLIEHLNFTRDEFVLL